MDRFRLQTTRAPEPITFDITPGPAVPRSRIQSSTNQESRPKVINFVDDILSRSRNNHFLQPSSKPQNLNLSVDAHQATTNALQISRYQTLYPKTFSRFTGNLSASRLPSFKSPDESTSSKLSLTKTLNPTTQEITRKPYISTRGKQAQDQAPSKEINITQIYPVADKYHLAQPRAERVNNMLKSYEKTKTEDNESQNVQKLIIGKMYQSTKPQQAYFPGLIPNPQQPEEINPAQRFPGYEVEKFLGKGKFSTVYLARQKESNFRVALKVISKQTIHEKQMEHQLAWEIKIQHLLRHPHIVRLYTFFQNGIHSQISLESEIILVLEHCGDGQLYEQLKQTIDGRLKEEQASLFVKQVTLALSFLHTNDVIHRDIKPENIMLSYVSLDVQQQGQAKLADFSFCIYSPSKNRQTQCGTIVYSSPELVSGLEYDRKSDMWSLGVLAYELCEGQTPWEELNKEDAVHMISKAQIICPNYFSRNLKSFIEGLTKKEPRERFNARQALSHPWLQSVKETTTSEAVKDLII